MRLRFALLARLSCWSFGARSPHRIAASADRLDPVTADAVQHLVDSARTSGLPTEPLVQKALEGSTLGAAGDRIRAAVSMLFAQLSRARAALGTSASDAEVTAAAGALRAGVPADTLQHLRALRSGRSLVVPISVLADLVAEGTPLDRAYRSVFDLARDGRPDDDFLALRHREVRQAVGAPDPADAQAPKPTRSPRQAMTARTLGVLAALAVGATPVEAQFTGALDVGAGTAHSDDAFSGPVATLAPSITFEGGIGTAAPPARIRAPSRAGGTSRAAPAPR